MELVPGEGAPLSEVVCEPPSQGALDILARVTKEPSTHRPRRLWGALQPRLVQGRP